MSIIRYRIKSGFFISLYIISWITSKFTNATYTNEYEETTWPITVSANEEYIRNTTPLTEENVTSPVVPATSNIYPKKNSSKAGIQEPQKDVNFNININLWLPVNYNSSGVNWGQLQTFQNSSSIPDDSNEDAIHNRIQNLPPLPFLQPNKIYSEENLPANNLNLGKGISNAHKNTNAYGSDGLRLLNSDNGFLRNDYSKKLIDIINDLIDIPNNGLKNGDKPDITKSQKKIQNWQENFVENVLNIVGKSRIKRSIYPRKDHRRIRPTNIIPRPEDKLPDSFNFNNRITDILLERFPPNKGFANSLRPNRFLSTRFSGTSGGSSRPPYGQANDNSLGNRPLSSPTSFDDLSLDGSANELNGIDISKRLGKLDSIFKSLNVDSEACKRRIMCEIARYSDEYSPLAEMIQFETRIISSLKRSARKLLDSPAGVRFLSYVDATTRGKDQYNQCDIYKYNCRSTVRDLIDMDSLIVWREVVGWLTVKVLAKD